MATTLVTIQHTHTLSRKHTGKSLKPQHTRTQMNVKCVLKYDLTCYWCLKAQAGRQYPFREERSILVCLHTHSRQPNLPPSRSHHSAVPSCHISLYIYFIFSLPFVRYSCLYFLPLLPFPHHLL